jgi:hypothetical protein
MTQIVLELPMDVMTEAERLGFHVYETGCASAGVADRP